MRQTCAGQARSTALFGMYRFSHNYLGHSYVGHNYLGHNYFALFGMRLRHTDTGYHGVLIPDGGYRSAAGPQLLGPCL